MNFISALSMESVPAQRAVGRLDLAFKHESGRTRVEKFYQQGCLKARLPRPQSETIIDVVTMNISGGVAGGDRLATTITLAAGAKACVAAQAAERVYRAQAPAPARITTAISLADQAALDYLPQETILFDGFALDRALTIELAENAEFVGVESLLFGRLAMGEVLQSGHLRDQIVLRRGGKLILQDMTRLDGNITAQLARPAIAAGAQAMATMIVAGPNAAGCLARLRQILAPWGAASLAQGVVFARLLAPDAAALRHCLIPAISAVRAGRPLPRVWQG